MKRTTPFVVLALFFLSGAAGLIYQFVWIRMLTHLLGGTSFAISSVLAAFMGGLALGSRWFGDRIDRAAAPLRVYALLEVGIGLLGALVLLALRAAPPVYLKLVWALPEPVHALLRVAVAIALLLPPTFLMGGTLPVLCRYWVRRPDRIGRGLGVVYAINTFGAVFGSFLAGFVLIHRLGLTASTAVAVALNVGIGFVALVLARTDGRLPDGSGDAASGARSAPPGSPEAGEVGRPEIAFGLLAVLFALSGFASLGFEIHWTRALHHFLGNSTYAYSAMLTTFLLGLSAGAWVGGFVADRAESPSRWLGWTQIAIGITVLATVPLVWGWLPGLVEGASLSSSSWGPYVLRRVGLAAVVMALPTTLVGMTFPLVNRIGVRSLSRLGEGVGVLYFANTVGAIAGSLAAGFVILPRLGAKDGLLATACLSLALGAAAHLASRVRRPRQTGIALVVVAALAATTPLLHRSGRSILSDSQEPGDTVLFRAEDPIAETRVYEKPGGERHMSVDGRHIGGTDRNVQRKEKILAHLPLALVPRATRVLAVGLGSGLTLGTLARYDEIESLTCVEIVPGVIRGARWFESSNRGVLDDPRTRIHAADGVQFLLTTRERYDVISSDSKLNPEYAGNSSLLATDYYELCRDRLTDHGVMVQWLVLHVPGTEMRTVIRSFADAFPHCALFFHHPYNVVLAGSRSPLVFDLDRVRAFAADGSLAEDLRALEIDDPYAFASLFVAGDDDLRAAAGDGPRSTWNRPILEFTIIRALLGVPRSTHEDGNLRWIVESLVPSGMTLRGEQDAAVRKRFLVSSRLFLRGWAAGGGIADARSGVELFRLGLSENPDDRRLRRVLRGLERQGL